MVLYHSSQFRLLFCFFQAKGSTLLPFGEYIGSWIFIQTLFHSYWVLCSYTRRPLQWPARQKFNCADTGPIYRPSRSFATRRLKEERRGYKPASFSLIHKKQKTMGDPRSTVQGQVGHNPLQRGGHPGWFSLDFIRQDSPCTSCNVGHEPRCGSLVLACYLLKLVHVCALIDGFSFFLSSGFSWVSPTVSSTFLTVAG